MKKLNIGIIGFGNHFTRVHLPQILQNKRVRIVAIADVLESQIESAKSILEQHEIRAPIYTSPDTALSQDTSSVEQMLLLNQGELEAAIITTPHTKHYPQIKMCLEHNLNVFVDKPLALTYSDALELIELADRKRLTLMVGSQRRYEMVFEYAHNVLVNRELGAIKQVNGLISAPSNHFNGWWANPDLAGGGAVLWNIGWHLVDTIVYLLGKRAVSVHGSLSRTPDRSKLAEAYATALIIFENEVSVSISANVGGPVGSVYERIQIWGSHGMLLLDRFKPQHDRIPATVVHQKLDGEVVENDFALASAKEWAPLEEYLSTLLLESDGVKPPAEPSLQLRSSGRASIETVRILEAIYQSYLTSKPIILVLEHSAQ